MASAASSHSGIYVTQSTRIAMRRLLHRDAGRVVQWMSDTEAMRELFPLNVITREVDAITLIERGSPSGSLMSWAFDLLDGTPVGMGSWCEDVPWYGVYHVEVIMSSLAPDRTALISDAYRLLCGHAFRTLPARKVSTKAVNVATDYADLFQHLGMIREGVLRGHASLDAIEYDIHVYGISRHEWGGHDDA